eukprot:g12258.t1
MDVLNQQQKLAQAWFVLEFLRGDENGDGVDELQLDEPDVFEVEAAEDIWRYTFTGSLVVFGFFAGEDAEVLV